MPENQETVRKSYDKVAHRKSISTDLSQYLFSKIPPQARELEEAVLGALMLDKEAVSEVVDILRPESFYVDAHQLIFEAVLSLFSESQPVDILTVIEELKSKGKLEAAGGTFYITELTNRVASSANVEFHARIIAQKHIQRELIRISTEIIKDSYEDTTDVFELLDKAERNLFEVTDKNLQRHSEGISTLISKAITEIETKKNHKEAVSGVQTGFVELDRKTSGWQSTDLIIIAARPGMGKTALTLNLARNAAVDFKKPVAFFSLEMSSVQLATRLISAETGLKANNLRKGKLEEYEWTQLTTKITSLTNAPIFIDDTPAINIFELRAKCRRLKVQHDIQLIIVDYLQLMSGTGDSKHGNREQEISNISRSLKSIAKELSVPVIALSQLSRAVETRSGVKRPQLSDLRESGAIEQDADVVIFIYRPEYYDIDKDSEGNSTKGIAELIIAKQRNGPTGEVKVKFNEDHIQFSDLDELDFDESENVFIDQEVGKTIVRGSKMNDTTDTTPDDDDNPL